MRGSIIKRYKSSWSIVLDDYEIDPRTGARRRRRRWMAVKGTKKDAEAKLAEVLNDTNRGQFVEPSKLTLGQWLDTWVDTAIKPPRKRIRTYETYRSVLECHLKPALGSIRLQQLQAVHLERYYNESPLSRATLQQHQSIVFAALKSARRKKLITVNVAEDVDGKPRAMRNHEDLKGQCWDETEARRFLETARKEGHQPAAFYTLALETGMRKAELCGLKWPDIDFDKGELKVLRQLVKCGSEPIFGPPKNGLPRGMTLSAETLQLLAEHRRHQAEVKMRNRMAYHDHGLVFAKDWSEMMYHTDHLGDPFQMNNLGQRQFAKLVKAAGVRPIRFHGLRHTSATLALRASIPTKVVSQRLGHKRVGITEDIYTHVLKSMDEEAARRMASILHR